MPSRNLIDALGDVLSVLPIGDLLEVDIGDSLKRKKQDVTHRLDELSETEKSLFRESVKTLHSTCSEYLHETTSGQPRFDEADYQLNPNKFPFTNVSTTVSTAIGSSKESSSQPSKDSTSKESSFYSLKYKDRNQMMGLLPGGQDYNYDDRSINVKDRVADRLDQFLASVFMKQPSEENIHASIDAMLAGGSGSCWDDSTAYHWRTLTGNGKLCSEPKDSERKFPAQLEIFPNINSGPSNQGLIGESDLAKSIKDLGSLGSYTGVATSTTSDEGKAGLAKSSSKDAGEGVTSENIKTYSDGFYVQRKRPDPSVSYARPEDEYHDDDDPGYRIREITEAELLDEISDNMRDNPQLQLQAQMAAQNQLEEAEAKEKAELLEKLSSQDSRDNTGDAIDTGTGNNANIDMFGSTSKYSTGTPNFETQNPTFYNTTPRKVPWSDKEAQRKKKNRGASTIPGIRYKQTNDPFYPCKMDGIVYDCFPLRIVYERDRTGFEESKEFPIRIGEIIAARYHVIEYLGSAAFSKAVQCQDLVTKQHVCLKIIRNEKDYLDQSLDEIKLLHFINTNCNDPDEKHVLKLIDSFYYKEHLILVTELLKDNLYEFSKYNRENSSRTRGEQGGEKPYFTKRRLQILSTDILKALEYIHSLNLIHCDLKPENILMKSYSRSEVKVIDFGSSCYIDDHLSSYVQSRSYRAPEVILGMKYNQTIDIWSLGCILAELWTGYVLFQNDSVQSLLARVLGIIGPLPLRVMTCGKHVPTYFTQDGRLYQELHSEERRLHLLVPKVTTLAHRLQLEEDDPFVDFIRSMLELDPAKRPTASECLKHAFLTSTAYTDIEDDDVE